MGMGLRDKLIEICLEIPIFVFGIQDFKDLELYLRDLEAFE